MSRFIFAISFILVLFGGVSAGIIKVPQNYAIIQAGIDAAVKGDTVLVAAGTYYENIDFKGKAISVASRFLVDGDTTHINSIHKLATAGVTMPADNSVVYKPAIVKMQEQWNLLPLTNPPTARYLHAQVYDAKRNVITVFGGWHYNPKTKTYTMYDDTWQADLNTNSWQQIVTATKPSPRGSHAVLDSSKDRIILFAGLAINGNTITTYNDLWEFSLDSLKWKQLTPVGAPPQNSGAPLVHDKVNNRVILFGGGQMDPPYQELNETWVLELDSLKWKKLTTIGTAPHARVGHSAVYDPKKHGLIILGGKYYNNGNVFLHDIWEMDLETLEWKEIVPFSPPQDYRAGMATILDERNDRIIMFGGENDNSSLNDLWEFNLTLKKWKELSPAGSLPEKRSWITGNYDPALNRMLVFGGNNSFTDMLNDTWELTLPEQPSIIRVPEDQSSIQTGIDAAVNGDVVLVRDSTYFENINFKGKAITVASYYLMDGDTTHINNTIIDGSQPTHADSGSVVFFISGEDTTSVLCGFTITGGTGTEATPPGGSARVGGGIFCYNSGARIINNKIIENTVHSPDKDVYGGGLAALPIASTAYVILQDNQISHNTLTADSKEVGGGGVELMGNGILVNNLISYNSIVHNASDYLAFSGGVDCFSLSTNRRKVIVESNKITHNSVVSKSNVLDPSATGGGISFVGSYGRCAKNEVSDNEVWANSNKGAGGAGIFINWAPASLIIEGNIIRKNMVKRGYGYGGGVLIGNNSSPMVINNIIEGNSATTGGGFLIATSTPQLINNTVINNQATSGGGINVRMSSTVYLMNNIVWGNQATNYAGIQREDGTVNAAYCDIQGGWTGTGNINADPLFADTLFHLSDKSPCIGAGISSFDFGGGMVCNCPPTDYDGNPRPNPVDEFVDMGAFESEYARTGDDVAARPEQMPTQFSLAQNYPNPFNPSTTIEFALPKPAFVTLKVYNLLGEEVATLVSEHREVGIHKLNWDARGLASGMYLYRLEAGEFVQAKKLILMR